MKKIMKIGIFLTIFLVTYGQQNMTTDATTTDDEADDIVRKMTINIYAKKNVLYKIPKYFNSKIL